MHNPVMSPAAGLRWLLKRSPGEFALNVLFVTWLAYFLATGSLVPEPLLRDQPGPVVVEVFEDAPSPAPPDPADEVVES